MTANMYTSALQDNKKDAADLSYLLDNSSKYDGAIIYHGFAVGVMGRDY